MFCSDNNQIPRKRLHQIMKSLLSNHCSQGNLLLFDLNIIVKELFLFYSKMFPFFLFIDLYLSNRFKFQTIILLNLLQIAIMTLIQNRTIKTDFSII